MTRTASRLSAAAIGTAALLLGAAFAAAPAGAAEVSEHDPFNASAWTAASTAGDQLAHAGLVTLRRSVEVTGSYLTLGELFTGTGADATVPVARSPKAGRSTILGADWLHRIARTHGLDWSPRSNLDQAVVSRPGRSIPAESVTEALRDALENLGALPGMDMQLTAGRFSVVVPVDAPPSVRVMDEQYDPVTHRFSAVVEAPAGDPEAERIRVTGRLHPVQEIPVLLRQISAGAVIGPADIDMKRVRSDRLSGDIVLDPNALVGQSSRQGLRPGQAIRRSQIIEPVVISKGDMVTMTLEAPGLSLTVQGQALEPGPLGGTVRIRNIASNQTVLATITGPNRVTVGGIHRAGSGSLAFR